jgi:regulator of protease activity HflC (stomatin/prohibitin superfamily)
MNVSSKRAGRVALMALILSVVFFVACFIVGIKSNSFAIISLSWQILSGGLVWLVLVLLFHQRALAEQEKLDMAQLASDQSSDTIFQSNANREALFAVSGKRLKVFEKWAVPIFAVIIAVYEIGISAYLLRRAPRAVDVDVVNPSLNAVIMVAFAFVAFLISRYATGMSVREEWKPLRAGGSYLLASAMLAFAVAISLALVQFKSTVMNTAMIWFIPSLMGLLGIETLLNTVLDIYRPRIHGQYSRPGFDSRLLGMLNEPGGILHTFSSAIDYQFGFQVSQTWFYRLFIKAVIPLVIFSTVMIYLLTCFVVVGPGQEAVVEHFGSFENGGRLIGPGITFKLPWPYEVARKYSTKEIQQVNVGFVEKHADGDDDRLKPYLWGESHYAAEYNLLVAANTEGSELQEGAVPVSLVRAAVPVQYRIKNLRDFVYNHSDSVKMLESICYREVTRLAASSMIENEEDGSSTNSILGGGRGAAAKLLTERIQSAADDAGLGVEIVFLGLQGVHPPPEVAADYQQVVGTIQLKQADILNAQAESNKILAGLAGSIAQANMLYELAGKIQEAKDSGDMQRASLLESELDAEFAEAKGDIFKTLREADSSAFEKVILAEATGKRFNNQLLAYQASPEIYKKQLRLAMLEEAFANIRKYVVIAESDDLQVYTIDLQEKLSPGLYDLNLDAMGQ